MPFTGSHPAAVLPLTRSGLVPSALVIGSMVPDLPYYLPLPSHLEVVASRQTHTTGGVFGLDLLLGLISFAVWQLLVVPFAVAAAPSAVRGRLAPELPVLWRSHLRSLLAVGLLVLSLWIGAASHVLWDEFTHINRWGYHHISWLATPQGPMDGYRWAQYGSGVVGGLLIADAIRRWWRTTSVADPLTQRVPELSRRNAVIVWTTIGVATIIGAVSGGVSVALNGQGIRTALFRIATWGGGLGMTAVLICALIWLTTAPSRLSSPRT